MTEQQALKFKEFFDAGKTVMLYYHHDFVCSPSWDIVTQFNIYPERIEVYINSGHHVVLWIAEDTRKISIPSKHVMVVTLLNDLEGLTEKEYIERAEAE